MSDRVVSNLKLSVDIWVKLYIRLNGLKSNKEREVDRCPIKNLRKCLSKFG